MHLGALALFDKVWIAEKYDEAYAVIDRIHHGPRDEVNVLGSIKEISDDAKELNRLQELFDLYVIEYRECQQCEKEAKLLKELCVLPASTAEIRMRSSRC